MNHVHESPLEHFRALGEHIGCELLVKRDDLLPFPLAGNKTRKLMAEFDEVAVHRAEVLITHGAVGSNHCRTLALLAAGSGRRSHLVLHGNADAHGHPALRLLSALGARWEIVEPDRIEDATRSAHAEYTAHGLAAYVVAGGCHTPAGARAYRRAARHLLADARPDAIFVASGTGATHGGIAAAAELTDRRPQVIGVSVARTVDRGLPAVTEAARWAGGRGEDVVFDDRYRAGGYGMSDARTDEAVRLGWRFGLPLDHTYTGKAFAALLDHCAGGHRRQRIVLWHTGGLMNFLMTPKPAPVAP